MFFFYYAFWLAMGQTAKNNDFGNKMMMLKETCRRIKMCTFHLFVDASMIHLLMAFEL